MEYSDILHGYTIERTPTGYQLTGKRGGIKVLVRDSKSPALMYVTDQYGQIGSIHGNYSWTDSDGRLAPYYTR